MEKQKAQYEDFISTVNPDIRGNVEELHSYLLENGCKIKVELAKSGYVVSYTHSKSKRVLVNFVFRKSGLIIRIYGDHVGKYPDLLDTLPQNMITAIEKAPVCKRLVDPTKCNSRCPMGYEFTLGQTAYQKCRYSSFMFLFEEANIPFIQLFVEKELANRAHLWKRN